MTLPPWLSINFLVELTFFKRDLKEPKIKLYSIGQASRFVLVTLIIGTGIGLIVSLVASLFVAGLHFLTDQRNRMDGYYPFLELADGSLVPMIWLIVAALLLWCVRRLFDIERPQVFLNQGEVSLVELLVEHHVQQPDCV